MFTKKITISIHYLILGCLLLIIGVFFYNRESVSQPKDTPTTKQTIVSDSTLEVSQKSSKDSPDLEVTQKYKAVLNNKEVEVPVNVTTTSDTSPTAGATSYTASLRQEIDITPLVKEAIPAWEIGVGAGVNKDRSVYIPLSIQRNYEVTKGVQVELHLDPEDRKIQGLEIQHKWRL